MKTLRRARSVSITVAFAGAIALSILTAGASHFAVAATEAGSSNLPEWYVGFQAATKASGERRFKDALAIAQSVDRLQGIPPSARRLIRSMVVQSAIKLKDYASAAAMNDRMLMANDGFQDTTLETCVIISMLQNRVERARDCARQFDAIANPNVR